MSEKLLVELIKKILKEEPVTKIEPASARGEEKPITGVRTKQVEPRSYDKDVEALFLKIMEDERKVPPPGWDKGKWFIELNKRLRLVQTKFQKMIRDELNS